MLELAPLVDEGVAAVKVSSMKAGDLLGIMRRMRAVGVLARTARAVAALARAPRPSKRQTQDQEDQMGDHNEDDSPENDERMRVELERRYDCLQRVIEKKRAAGWHVVRGVAPVDGESLRAA